MSAYRPRDTIRVVDPGGYGPPMDDCVGLRLGDVGLVGSVWNDPNNGPVLVCFFKDRFRQSGYYLHPDQVELGPSQLTIGDH